MATTDQNTPLIFRCPYCFARGIDSAYLDHEGGEYFCTRCVFVGTQPDILAAYHAYQGRYRLMKVRLSLLSDRT